MVSPPRSGTSQAIGSSDGRGLLILASPLLQTRPLAPPKATFQPRSAQSRSTPSTASPPRASAQRANAPTPPRAATRAPTRRTKRSKRKRRDGKLRGPSRVQARAEDSGPDMGRCRPKLGRHRPNPGPDSPSTTKQGPTFGRCRPRFGQLRPTGVQLASGHICSTKGWQARSTVLPPMANGGPHLVNIRPN